MYFSLDNTNYLNGVLSRVLFEMQVYKDKNL